MIFNFLKHLIVALLLDAGAAMAFDIDAGEPAPVAVAAMPAQSCALPTALITSNDSGTQS